MAGSGDVERFGSAPQRPELRDNDVRTRRDRGAITRTLGGRRRSGPLHRERCLLAGSQSSHISRRVREAVRVRPEPHRAVDCVHKRLLQTRAKIPFAGCGGNIGDDNSEDRLFADLVGRVLDRRFDGKRLVRALTGRNRGPRSCGPRRGGRGTGRRDRLRAAARVVGRTVAAVGRCRTCSGGNAHRRACCRSPGIGSVITADGTDDPHQHKEHNDHDTDAQCSAAPIDLRRQRSSRFQHVYTVGAGALQVTDQPRRVGVEPRHTATGTSLPRRFRRYRPRSRAAARDPRKVCR